MWSLVPFIRRGSEQTGEGDPEGQGVMRGSDRVKGVCVSVDTVLGSLR